MDLRLDLVALGHGDVAHVVAEPGQAQRPHLGQPAGGPGPGADGGADPGVADVTDHGLAGHTQPGLDVGELTVAVGRLVQVHEVHVDVGPGQLEVSRPYMPWLPVRNQISAGAASIVTVFPYGRPV